MNRFLLKLSLLLWGLVLLLAPAVTQAQSVGQCANGTSPHVTEGCPPPPRVGTPRAEEYWPSKFVCLDDKFIVRGEPDRNGKCDNFPGTTAMGPNGSNTPPVQDPNQGTPPRTTPPTPTTGGPALLCDTTFSTTKNGLCLPNNPLGNPTGIAGSGSLTELAAKIIDILLYFSGIVAVIFVIYGGYVYMTAGGNEENATKGRRILTDAIIGLVIVIMAYVIITSVSNFILNK